MKASTVIAVLAASLVSAQLDQIPGCALTCAISSIGSSGCGQTDIPCICKATAFINALTPCVQAACSPADLQKTIAAAEGLCSSVGVSLSIPAAGGSSTMAPSSSEAMSSAPMTTTVATTSVETSSVVVVSSTTVESTMTTSMMTSMMTSTTMTMPSYNGTATGSVSIPTPTPSGSTAGRNAVALSGLGAIAAIAAALL